MSSTYPRPTPAAKQARGAVIISIIVALMGGCGRTDPFTVEQHVQRAQSMLASNQIKAAEIELKTALQRDGRNVDARLGLADVYLATGRGREAENELAQAEKAGARREATLLRRVRAYLLQGQFDRVLKETSANPVGDPRNVAEIFEARGDAQHSLGRIAEARDSYNAALKVRPNSINALYGKARIAAAQGDLKKSMELIDAALAVSPRDSVGLILKGDLLLAMGDTDGAIKTYSDAVKLHPDNGSAHLALASALIAAKKYDAAAEHIALVKKASPTLPSANYLDATLLFAQGKNQEAFNAVQKVLAALPDHPPALILAAAIQYQLGSQLQAETNTRKFLIRYPNNVFARKLLAAILLKSNQPAKAFEILEPLVDHSDVKDPQVFALAGNALIESKRYPEAIEYLSKAAAMSPTDTTIRTALGIGRMSVGDIDRAISSFESVVKIDTKNSSANTLLVLSYIGKKDFQKAIDTASGFVKADPNNADLYNLLGGAYLAKKDLANARASFEKALKLRPDLAPAAINLAKIDLFENKPADAKKRLTDVLDHDRKNVDALLALSNMEFAEGHADAGARWLEVAAKENPKLLGPALLQIRYYLQKGDAQRAVRIARDAEPANPTNAELLALLAESQAASGDRNGAVATYGRLAALQPRSPRIQLEIARLEMADRHTTGAASALEKALSIDPEFVEAQAALAQLDIQTGKYDEARDIASRLQTKQPRSAVGLLLAGDAWMGQQKYDRAIKAYEDAMAREKSPLAVSKLYLAMTRAGKVKEAEDLMDTWLTQHKTDKVARLVLAAESESSGNAARAGDLYQQVLQIDPNDVVALNELALIYSKQKDPRAVEFAERAYRLQPSSDVIGDTLAWILVKNGNVARGQQILEKIVITSPGYAEARYHLAVALVQSGHKERARSELTQALASPNKFPQSGDAKKLLSEL